MPKKNEKQKKKAVLKTKPLAKVEVKAKPTLKSQAKAVKPAKPTKSLPAGKLKVSPIEKAKASVRQAIEKVTKVARGALPQEASSKGKNAKSGKTVALKDPVKEAKVKAPAVKAQKVDAKKVPAKPTVEKTPKGKVAPPTKPGRTEAKVELKVDKKSKPADPKQLAGKRAAAQLARSLNRCREPGCDSEALLSGYCRLHYIKNWRRIKKKEAIVMTGQLDGYVEELVAKYPDKYLDAIENDLASEKEWTKVITDLEFGATEDDFVADEEDAGLPEAASRRSGFDDEGEDVF